MKSLTSSHTKHLQIGHSTLKKRRESSKLRGERVKRGLLTKNFIDEGSPAHHNKPKEHHSELKSIKEALIKAQDARQEPSSAGLPHSLEFCLKRPGQQQLYNQLSAAPKQFHPNLQTRDKSVNNVLKNQEYKIRQLDRHSKRTNEMIEQFNDGSLGGQMQRITSQASD